MKFRTLQIICFLVIGSIIMNGCASFRHSTPNQTQQNNPIQESVSENAPETPSSDISPLLVDFHNEKVDVYHENKWSMEYAIKQSYKVSVQTQNMENQNIEEILTYSEYWTDDFSVFVPPTIARSPNGKQYLYSTATEFLLWALGTDEAICLANAQITSDSMDPPPSDSQSWQYHYSSRYKDPIWGVYPPRYIKWSFDGRYCSVDIPVYREGSGGLIFDLQNMDTVSIGDDIHSFIGSGMDIHWSPVANQFVSSTASTGWNDRQFVISHLENGAMKDLTEILPHNFEETYNAIYSPDGTRIAFLGITSSSLYHYQPTLYELDLQSHTLAQVYTLPENHYSSSIPFFYSPDGQALFYATRLENSWTLSKFDFETKAKEEIAIWASPEKSYEPHLLDWFWHNDYVFLTFYLVLESEPGSSTFTRNIQSQIFGIQPDQKELHVRSDIFQGKVKLLNIQLH